MTTICPRKYKIDKKIKRLYFIIRDNLLFLINIVYNETERKINLTFVNNISNIVNMLDKEK